MSMTAVALGDEGVCGSADDPKPCPRLASREAPPHDASNGRHSARARQARLDDGEGMAKLPGREAVETLYDSGARQALSRRD
jgi:hypothetical protein